MIEVRNGRRRISTWIPVALYAETQYQANMASKTLTEYVIEALKEKNSKGAGNENKCSRKPSLKAVSQAERPPPLFSRSLQYSIVFQHDEQEGDRQWR